MSAVLSARVVVWYFALYMAASLYSLIDPRVASSLAVAFAPIGGIAVFTMWQAGRAAAARRERLAWWLVAAGNGVYWIGGQIWTWSLTTQRPFPLDNSFDVVSTTLIISGLLCFPRGSPGWWRDRRVVLDAVLLAVAVTTLLWLFFLQPIPARTSETLDEFIVHILVTAPELVVVAWVYLRAGNHPVRAPLGLLLGATVLSVSSDFLWEELSTLYFPGSWVDMPWFVAWGMRWYAAHHAVVSHHRDADETRVRHEHGITPAVIVAAAYVCLVIAAVLGRTDSVRVLGMVAVTMTALLLVRQRLELRHTQSLTSQAASQLRRFRALLMQSTDFVWVLDRSLTVTFSGPAALRADLVRTGDPFLLAFDQAEHELLREWFGGASEHGPTLRCRLRAAADSTIELRKQDRRHDARIRGWVVVGRDRSTELVLQQRVRHSEKLAALHEMAGRVAHAYNNLLSSVMGRAELLREALPAASPLQDDVASLHSAAERGAAITRQLLGFSDAHAARTLVVNGADVLTGLVPVLQPLLPPHIQLDVSRVQPDVFVRVEASQFEQVITNLVTNARDAMPDGGVVRITWTGDADSARLEVSDTGIGIPLELQKRVFDPFFTTKAVGKGTGLGLAMVAAMVQRAEGVVTLHSTPNVGTRVAVELPRVSAVAPAMVVPTATVAPQQDTVRTILLVDDDRDVRQVSARILRRAGFEVVEAENGTTALAVLADASRVLDLLVTDMMMPGISGADLVTLSRQLRPALPIICITGFVAASVGGTQWQDTVDAVVEKPFSASGLIDTVRNVLVRTSSV